MQEYWFSFGQSLWVFHLSVIRVSSFLNVNWEQFKSSQVKKLVSDREILQLQAFSLLNWTLLNWIILVPFSKLINKGLFDELLLQILIFFRNLYFFPKSSKRLIPSFSSYFFFFLSKRLKVIKQQVIIYSKSIQETLEHVKTYNNDTRTMLSTPFWCFCC